MKHLSVLLFLLTSCASVPDVPVCVENTISKAHCVKIISGAEFDITDDILFEGKTYWDIRPEMILVPVSSWVELKKFIVKECKLSGKCDQKVSGWDRTIDNLDKSLSSKNLP